MKSTAEIFTEQLGDAADVSGEELAPALDSMIEAAREAWPAVEIADEEFVAYLASHMPEGVPVEQALEEVRPADFYLACACARGDDRGIAAFDDRFRVLLQAIVHRFRFRRALPEDALQILREKILVGDAERAPRIASYGGRGALKNWVRATAVRALIDLTRADKREAGEVAVADDVLMSIPSPEGDPELDHLKRLYRSEFKVAFEQAVSELSARQRNMLRQHFVHGLSTGQIGAIYRVHKATAARRLVAARERLLAGTREHLVRNLQVGRDDVDSIMRLIESHIDISMQRLLATVTEVTEPDAGSRTG